MGLAGLQSAVAALTTATNQVIADVQKLLANQTGGLQPGQVIVQQADIDALTASVSALTTSEQAADATVNPPAPATPPAAAPTSSPATPVAATAPTKVSTSL